MHLSRKRTQQTCSGASRQTIVLGLIVWTVAVSRFPLFAAQGGTRQLPTLEGKLLSIPEQGPVLRIHEKDQPLSATTTYLFHTLQDKRLDNREVRVEGTAKAEGVFEVERLYTVRDGKLYRVRYFCKVCNIEALEPGDCVCCQQPTELQEIPVTDDTK
jgi:hypothetical protein